MWGMVWEIVGGGYFGGRLRYGAGRREDEERVSRGVYYTLFRVRGKENDERVCEMKIRGTEVCLYVHARRSVRARL